MPLTGRMTRTGHEVVVNEAARLHESVNDGGADELETPLEQIVAQRIALRCSRRHGLAGAAAIYPRHAADERPNVSIKAAEFFLHRSERFRVLNRRGNLQPIAHDPRISEQSGHFFRVVPRDLRHIEPIKSAPVIFPFVQNGRPAQPRLRAFQDEQLEPRAVIMQGHTPFGVVISEIERRFGPGARAWFWHAREITRTSDSVVSGAIGQLNHWAARSVVQFENPLAAARSILHPARMNRTDRLVAMVMFLQGRRVVKAEELANHFEITVRTVYRDVVALSEAALCGW